nr:bacterial Cytochrome Ubiquinol Oxidase [uncultured bacterium]
MDALMLSLIQFGANITFHILFPAITVALCWVLLFFKLRYDTTSDEKWLDAYRFWVKPFALFRAYHPWLHLLFLSRVRGEGARAHILLNAASRVFVCAAARSRL